MFTGAVWSIGGNVAGAAASLVTQMILARALEATRYGVYSYLLAWVNVAVVFGKLEFDTAAVRFIGTYVGQRNDGLLLGFLRYGRRVVGGTATGIAIIAGVVAWLLRDRMPPGAEQAVLAACVLVPLSALLLFNGSALQGFQRIPQAQLQQLLLRPVLFGVGIVLVTSGLRLELGTGGAIAINALATAVALGVSLLLLSRARPGVAAAPAFDTARWMSAVRGFMLIATAQLVLSQQADILVVGTLLSARDAGLYSAASQLASLVAFGATAVIFVVLPVISELHAQGRQQDLQRLVVRTVQGCAAVSVPITILLFAAGHIVLRWYGEAFDDAYLVMIVLSTAQLFQATIGIVSGFLLTMTGHEWEASRVIVGTAVLNLALTLVLTPWFGAVGAAAATAVAGLIKLSLLRWYARRYLGVKVLPYLPAAPPAAAGT
jgi:O-antigen/teichoic acid export membrane protein